MVADHITKKARIRTIRAKATIRRNDRLPTLPANSDKPGRVRELDKYEKSSHFGPRPA